MPNQRHFRSLFVVFLAACTPELEGGWTGGCDVDGGLRIQIEFADSFGDDPVMLAEGVLHLASVPGDYLAFDCNEVDQADDLVAVQNCPATWTVDTAADLVFFGLNGELYRSKPSPEMLGTCYFDGTEGQLELWNTP